LGIFEQLAGVHVFDAPRSCRRRSKLVRGVPAIMARAVAALLEA
jgi:hypothetical protein